MRLPFMIVDGNWVETRHGGSGGTNSWPEYMQLFHLYGTGVSEESGLWAEFEKTDIGIIKASLEYWRRSLRLYQLMLLRCLQRTLRRTSLPLFWESPVAWMFP